MKLTITREKLQGGLAAVLGTIASRSTLPALRSVMLEAERDRLRLTTTDLDTTTIFDVPCDLDTAGSVCVDAKRLEAIAREAPPAPIAIQRKGKRVELRVGRVKFSLPAFDTDEFPTIQRVGFGADHVVKASDLWALIDQVAFCVSTSENRPILNAVFWEIREGRMSMVATNGHRLAKMGVPVEVPAGVGISSATEPENDLLVLPRALAQVKRIFEEADELEVSRSENLLAIRAREAQVITRLVEGPYPAYDQIIPRDSGKVLIADRAALIAAVRRAGIMAQDQTHRLALTMGGPMLKVDSVTPDLGEAHEELPVEYEGKRLQVGANAKYLHQILDHIPSDEVRLSFTETERPVLIEPLDEKLDDLRYLLMPLRLLDPIGEAEAAPA